MTFLLQDGTITQASADGSVMFQVRMAKILACLAVLAGVVHTWLGGTLVAGLFSSPGCFMALVAAFTIILGLAHLAAAWMVLFSYGRSSVQLLCAVGAVWVWELSAHLSAASAPARRMPDDLLLENMVFFGPVLVAYIFYRCCFRMLAPSAAVTVLLHPPGEPPGSEAG